MTEVRVSSRSIYEHHVLIKKPNTYIQWTFSTKKNSISFGLYYKPLSNHKSSARTSIQTNDLDQSEDNEFNGDNASSNESLVSSSTANKEKISRRKSATVATTHSTNSFEVEAAERKRNFSLPKLGISSTKSSDSNTTTDPNTPTTKSVPAIENIYMTSNNNNNNNNMKSVIGSTKSDRRKSSSALSATYLLRHNFIEIIPISHQPDSSKQPIVGSYLAEEVGNFVLVFDNTFSISTPKEITLDVTTSTNSPLTLSDPQRPMSFAATLACENHMNEAQELPPTHIDMSGWLLKKRRKRMQGWVKRWFELSSTGILTYSVGENDKTKRGSIQITLASISVLLKQRMIHLDSGTTIFHLKTFSNDSFEDWIGAIKKRRKFLNSPNYRNMIWNHHDQAQSATSLLSDLEVGNNSNPDEKNTVENKYHLQIGQGLDDMENEIKNLQQLTQSTSSDYNSTIVPEQQPSITSSNDNKMLRRFSFKRVSSDNSSANSSHTLTRSAEHLQNMESIGQSLKILMDLRNDVYKAYHNLHQTSLSTTFNNDHPLLESHVDPRPHSVDQFYDCTEDTVISLDENGLSGSNESIAIDSEDEIEQDQHNISRRQSTEQYVITRRRTLPHPVAVKTISVLDVLRKNIGKDLSTISLPIYLNEPLNILQRLCEELEYSDLLDKAAAQTSSIDRLVYVAAFVISGYAYSQYRIGRKPFNPVLCETYECIRPERGFKFFAEKVSHQPNIMACYAESKNYQFRQSYFAKTKFWGKSLELISEGIQHLKLFPKDSPSSAEEYTWVKPSSWMRNLVAGTKYMEHLGELKLSNHTTGEYATIVFKESTSGRFFSSNTVPDRNNIEGKFYDCQGNLKRQIAGKWSDTIFETTSSSDQPTVLWKAKQPNVSNYQDYYGFTQFASELNEITEVEKDRLPMTDCRLRPDQRLFENGIVAESEDEKVRIEQKQRERRKLYAAEKKVWKPLWFELKEDSFAATGESWQYKGGYFEARETGDWPKEMLQLW